MVYDEVENERENTAIDSLPALVVCIYAYHNLHGVEIKKLQYRRPLHRRTIRPYHISISTRLLARKGIFHPIMDSNSKNKYILPNKQGITKAR